MSHVVIIKNLLGLVVGAFCLIVSVLVLFYFYAFASMIDPQLQGLAYWRAVLGKVFGLYEGVAAWPMLLLFVFSIGLILWSAVGLALRLMKRS